MLFGLINSRLLLLPAPQRAAEHRARLSPLSGLWMCLQMGRLFLQFFTSQQLAAQPEGHPGAQIPSCTMNRSAFWVLIFEMKECVKNRNSLLKKLLSCYTQMSETTCIRSPTDRFALPNPLLLVVTPKSCHRPVSEPGEHFYSLPLSFMLNYDQGQTIVCSLCLAHWPHLPIPAAGLRVRNQ